MRSPSLPDTTITLVSFRGVLRPLATEEDPVNPSFPPLGLRHQGPGSDDQWPIGSRKCDAERIDGASIRFRSRCVVIEVVDEGGVDYTVGRDGAAAQAFQIFQRTAMHFGSGCGKVFGRLLRARETEHLMTCADELFHDCGTDETCSTCYENTHILSLLRICGRIERDDALTRLASRVKTLAVIHRHSRVEAGRLSISITS